MSTFVQLRQYAALRFRDKGNAVVSDTDWKSYLNDAYEDMLTRCTWFPWNETAGNVTVLANTQSIALPADAWQVLSVKNGTDLLPMFPIEGRDEVNYQYPDLSVTGAPQHYRLSGPNIFVYPKPVQDTVLNLEYVHRPADMAADGDVPVFPPQYHTTIVDGALALAYTDDGNFQMAQIHEADFEAEIKAMLQDMMQPRNSRFYEPTDNLF